MRRTPAYWVIGIKGAACREALVGVLVDLNAAQDSGIQLLEPASDAHELFLEKEPREKGRLLAFMVSERSAINDGGSRTGRVLALSN